MLPVIKIMKISCAAFAVNHQGIFLLRLHLFSKKLSFRNPNLCYKVANYCMKMFEIKKIYILLKFSIAKLSNAMSLIFI